METKVNDLNFTYNRTIIALALLLFPQLGLCGTIQPGALEWFIGRCDVVVQPEDKPQSYTISTQFGVEKWVDGKRTSDLAQLWNLVCQRYQGESEGYQRNCKLERTSIDPKPKDPNVSPAQTITNDSEQHSLQFTLEDWPEAHIAFTIPHLDVVQVELRMRCNKVSGELFLADFQAKTVPTKVGGATSIIEWKIPAVSYQDAKQNVEIRGLRSPLGAEIKRAVESLGKKDQALWAEFERANLPKCIGLEFLDYAPTTLWFFDPETTEVPSAERLPRWQRCLDEAKLSSDGRKKLITFAKTKIKK